MKDYLIVVDANFPSGARLAMADAKRVSSKPVKFVFDTHHHGDHTYGNAVWTGAGATTIAYQGVAEEMKRYEPARWQDSMKERKDVADMHRDTPEPPQQTFTDSPHVITDGTRRVEFYHFGWAHTRGDGLVYLPRERVLCSGDAAVNGPYNYTGDGNIGNWPKVLDGALKLKVDHVLPGHGGAGGKEILTGQRAFMIELRKAVQAQVASGKKLGDLVKTDERQTSGDAASARCGEELGERGFFARSGEGRVQRSDQRESGGGSSSLGRSQGACATCDRFRCRLEPYGGSLRFPTGARGGTAPFAGRRPGCAA